MELSQQVITPITLTLTLTINLTLKFMGDDHFKFLGKGLVKDISDSYAKMLVKHKFSNYTALIDGTLP